MMVSGSDMAVDAIVRRLGLSSVEALMRRVFAGLLTLTDALGDPYALILHATATAPRTADVLSGTITAGRVRRPR